MAAGNNDKPSSLGWWVRGVVAVVLALTVWLLWRSRRPLPRAPSHEVGSAAPAAGEVHVARAAPAAPASTSSAHAAASPAAPVIDAITVDRPSLCLGEESLVRVRAHAPDGDDAELHYTVGPKTGAIVGLRAWVDERGAQLPYDVTVFGRGGLSATARVPAFTIRHCRADAQVVVAHRLLPNTMGVYEFRAAVVSPSTDGTGDERPRFVPRSYAWQTSEGARSESGSALFTDDLEDRPQGTLYSQVTLSVVVTAADGRRLTGYDALQLGNPAYESMSRKGQVMLMVRLTPRWPLLSKEGTVTQGVALWHHHRSPVTLERLRAVRYYQAGRGEAPAQALDVAAVLGRSVIAPSTRLSFDVRLDTHRDPEVIAINYYLEGSTPEGYAVRGAFAVMVPPPAPTRENSAEVRDPRMVSRIRAAQRLLGRATVSDEDIWRLEREGQLDMVKRPGAEPGAPAAGHSPSSPAAPRRDDRPSPSPGAAQPTMAPGAAPPGPRQ